MSFFSDYMRGHPVDPSTEAKMLVTKARLRILDKIQIRIEDGHRFARWHLTVEADGHDWLSVDGLAAGQVALLLFKEQTPVGQDLWEDAKVVFPRHYAELG